MNNESEKYLFSPLFAYSIVLSLSRGDRTCNGVSLDRSTRKVLTNLWSPRNNGTCHFYALGHLGQFAPQHFFGYARYLRVAGSQSSTAPTSPSHKGAQTYIIYVWLWIVRFIRQPASIFTTWCPTSSIVRELSRTDTICQMRVLRFEPLLTLEFHKWYSCLYSSVYSLSGILELV